MKKLTPLQVLKRKEAGKKEVKVYNYRTQSPLRSSLSNAFGSPSTSLYRQGYSSKEIKSASRRSRNKELNRQRAQKVLNRGMGSIFGL